MKANVRKSVSRGGSTVRLNTLELRPNNSVKTKTKQRQVCLRGHFFSDRNVALVRCGHMGRLLASQQIRLGIRVNTLKS